MLRLEHFVVSYSYTPLNQRKMAKVRSEKYAQYPLYLLGEMHKDKEGTLNKMLCFGIYYYAMRLEEYKDLNVQLEKASEFLDVSGLFSNDNIMTEVLAIQDVEGYDKSLPMFKVNKLLEFRNEKKKVKEIDVYVAYLAIHSMLGEKNNWFLVTNEFLVARMMGLLSNKNLPEYLPPHLVNLRWRYNTPIKCRTLLDKLQLDWYVIKYALKEHGYHGYHVTIKGKWTKKQLISFVEGKTKKARLRKLKEEEEKLRQEVLTELTQKQPP